MNVFRTIALIVVVAAISVAGTSWLINRRLADARLAMAQPAGAAGPQDPLGAVAGAAKQQASRDIANPLADDPAAIAEGHRLFIAMNCAGCHGYDAKGNMGPDLTDTYWRYGGTPKDIYQSILDGRPQGMPEWGLALPKQSIWQLVAYVSSLGVKTSQTAQPPQGGAGQAPGANAGEKP